MTVTQIANVIGDALADYNYEITEIQVTNLQPSQRASVHLIVKPGPAVAEDDEGVYYIMEKEREVPS